MDNSDVELYPSEYPSEYTSDSVPDPDITLIKSIYDDELGQLLYLFHSEHDDNIFYVDLQTIQDWLVVDTSSKFYTVSTVLFINTKEQTLELPNVYQTFLLSSQPKTMWNQTTKTQDMTKELGLFSAAKKTPP